MRSPIGCAVSSCCGGGYGSIFRRRGLQNGSDSSHRRSRDFKPRGRSQQIKLERRRGAGSRCGTDSVKDSAVTTIHLGISTCPNDTFLLHGLLTRSVDWRGLQFEVELIDIQQLNDRLFCRKNTMSRKPAFTQRCCCRTKRLSCRQVPHWDLELVPCCWLPDLLNVRNVSCKSRFVLVSTQPRLSYFSYSIRVQLRSGRLYFRDYAGSETRQS